MNKKLVSLSALALLLLAGNASAYVALSPARTWDCPVNYIVDNRAGGIPSITDADSGRTRVINAITSTADAWNSEGSGTVINAQAGSVSGFALGDGVPMLNFTDPLSACTLSCLAATFTGYYSERSAGLGLVSHRRRRHRDQRQRVQLDLPGRGPRPDPPARPREA